MRWEEMVDAVLGAEAPLWRREWVRGVGADALEEWRVQQRTALCEWRCEVAGRVRGVCCHSIAGVVVVGNLAVCVAHWGIWRCQQIEVRLERWQEEGVEDDARPHRAD
jgi:hypothetical protein